MIKEIEFPLIAGLIVAAAMISAFFVLGIEDPSGEDVFTEEESKRIALDFVENSPTYSFDGFDLKYDETLYPEIVDRPDLWTFVFKFKTKHAGYGDRAGRPLPQVITDREAQVTVENGEVIRALLDQRWDMIDQRFVDSGDVRFESYVFDQGGSGALIEGGLKHSSSNIERKNFASVLTRQEETERFEFSLLGSEARELITETDFEESILIVFQEFPASSVPDYRVERLLFDNDILRVFVNDSSKFGTDDITVETLLLRVNLEGGSQPDKVSIILEDGREIEPNLG